MKFKELFKLILLSLLLTSFYLPLLIAQDDNCLVPEIEAWQAMLDYRQILEERGDAIPESRRIQISDAELILALREHLCDINDALYRMKESEGRSFFELNDQHLIDPSARIYPFYYHRQPNRTLDLNGWQRDMNEILDQHGLAFNINFDRLVMDRIEAGRGRIFVSADYTFFPAFNEDNRTVLNNNVSRRMDLVFDYATSHRVEKGYILTLRTISGDISTRREDSYSEFYVHATGGIESYSNEMSSFWSASDRNILAELSFLPGDLEGADGSLNSEAFGSWNLESAVSWGIDLGYAFTLDRFGKHGIDIAVGLHFSKIEAAFNHNGLGIYSGEDHYSAFNNVNELGVNADTRYWLGYLESARVEASRTSFNIMMGYRYNFMNLKRQLIYLSPRLFINSSLSYSNVESAAQLGFGFVSGVKNDNGDLIGFGYGQFTQDGIGERSMENAVADGGLLYGLGLAAGFIIPMDKAGNIFFSGRLYYDFAIGGSALNHSGRKQHYLNSRDFNEGSNYLSDFGNYIRSSRFGLGVGLSYLILQ